MISNNQRKVEVISDGPGIPFYVPKRYEVTMNDYERQTPIYIDLSDLNDGRGMPKNFTDKRGRIVPTISRYWTSQEFSSVVNLAKDIE